MADEHDDDIVPGPYDDEEERLKRENPEGLIFSRIVRHIAEQMGQAEAAGQNPGEGPHQTSALFHEIADAFEQTGGFEFMAEQALPLSHAFVLIEAGMRTLSEQATGLGHVDAAAKMEWAAGRARMMTAKLEERHLAGAGGIVTFDDIDDMPSVH